jgi:hypothetical protein
MSRRANRQLRNQKRQNRPKVSSRSQLEEPEIRYNKRVVRPVEQNTTSSTQSPRRRTRHCNNEPAIKIEFPEIRNPDIIEKTLYQLYTLYRNLNTERTAVEAIEEAYYRNLGLIYPPECLKRELLRTKVQIVTTLTVIVAISILIKVITILY